MAPYPAELEQAGLLRDGRSVMIRAVLAADEQAMLDFSRRLSRRTLAQRLLGPVPRFRRELLRQFVDVDYADHLALVAFLDDQMIGVGRLIRLEDTDHAEVTFTSGRAPVAGETAQPARGRGDRREPAARHDRAPDPGQPDRVRFPRSGVPGQSGGGRGGRETGRGPRAGPAAAGGSRRHRDPAGHRPSPGRASPPSPRPCASARRDLGHELPVVCGTALGALTAWGAGSRRSHRILLPVSSLPSPLRAGRN